MHYINILIQANMVCNDSSTHSTKSSNNLKKFKRQLSKSKQVQSISLSEFPLLSNSPPKSNYSRTGEVIPSEPAQPYAQALLLSSSPPLSLSPTTQLKFTSSENQSLIPNLITLDIVTNILKFYNVNTQTTNLELYRKAMIHKSYASVVMNAKYDNYERLEWYGDVIIHSIISKYIFIRYEDEQEGFLTQLRSKLENTEMLARFCKIIGLDNYIQTMNLDINEGNDKLKKQYADIFESFIAALEFDTSFHVCEEFLINLIECEVDFAELLNNETNYKTRLLQYCHKMKWQDPIYKVLKMESVSNEYKFIVEASSSVKSDNSTICFQTCKGNGEGNNKKLAEQRAAQNALINLGILV